jgi:hypothetical protein
MSEVKDLDTFKYDGFLNGLLDVDITAFDEVKWPPLDKEFLSTKALKEIEKIKSQLEPIFKTKYKNIQHNLTGIYKGPAEKVRGNVIVYLDKSHHTTDNYVEITALDRCRVFPDQGEYLWFNDSIKFVKRFNSDKVNNIRFIYFDYKLDGELFKDFLEKAEEEKQELEESMKESFRQRDERKKTESERLQDELEPL